MNPMNKMRCIYFDVKNHLDKSYVTSKTRKKRKKRVRKQKKW